MSTNAAKAFVARWANDLGDSYLSFLFACEKIVQEKVPLLATEIEKLKSKINGLTKPRKRQKGRRKVEVITKTIVTKSIFGEDVHQKIIEEKTIDEMTDKEYSAYKMQHNSKVMKGLSGKSLEIIQGLKESAALESPMSEIVDRINTFEKMVNKPAYDEIKAAKVKAISSKKSKRCNRKVAACKAQHTGEMKW